MSIKSPMFSFINVNTADKSQPLSIAVKYGEGEVAFDVSAILSKRNKDELAESSFLLLNEYLNWKGEEFKSKLYNIYLQADKDVFNTARLKITDGLPTYIIKDILAILDLEDIVNFLITVRHIIPPENLATEFNQQIETDGRGSRDQTYIKRDYIELAALTLIIKCVIGPLGAYIGYKIKDVSNHHKEYLLLHFLTEYPIYQSDPMVKLLNLIKKLIEVPTPNSDIESDIRTIEKGLPKDEMPKYILGITIVQKLATASIIYDSRDKNIITAIYNYTNNKLRPNGDVARSIRPKTALGSAGGDSGDKESLIESYRIITDLPRGEIIALNWSVESIPQVLMQMGFTTDPNNTTAMYIDPALIDMGVDTARHMLDKEIDRVQIQIIAIIFKRMFDPRGIDYLEIDGLLNMFVVGFAYLWTLGYKSLALLLMSVADNNVNDDYSFTPTVNKNRLPKELTDELNVFFPLTRSVNDEKSSSLVIEFISALGNALFTKKWVVLLPTEYTREATIESNGAIIPNDIKIILAKFILEHERRR